MNNWKITFTGDNESLQANYTSF